MIKEIQIPVRKFLCGYCRCIFIADRDSYKVLHENEYDFEYECVCPSCGRATRQNLGTEVKVIKLNTGRGIK